MFNKEEYFTAKKEVIVLKNQLNKLVRLINETNIVNHFEPLTYQQFWPAIEFWYNAHNNDKNHFSNCQANIAFGMWKDNWEQFISTGTCDNLYTKLVMSGWSYEKAFIEEWNNGPLHSCGGFKIKRNFITEISYHRTR